MAWNEKDSRAVRSQSGKGIPAQPEAPVCEDLLPVRERYRKTIRLIGTQQYRNDEDLYYDIRERTQEADGEVKTDNVEETEYWLCSNTKDASTYQTLIF